MRESNGVWNAFRTGDERLCSDLGLGYLHLPSALKTRSFLVRFFFISVPKTGQGTDFFISDKNIKKLKKMLWAYCHVTSCESILHQRQVAQIKHRSKTDSVLKHIDLNSFGKHISFRLTLNSHIFWSEYLKSSNVHRTLKMNQLFVESMEHEPAFFISAPKIAQNQFY